MKFADVLKPTSEAKGLPNECYISSTHFDTERKQIFFRNWSGIAFESDVAEPGSVYPVDFLGMPLLVVRSRDDEIKVFQNTCRHRGMILVDKAQKLKGPIRCPYHSWSYSHDGDLVRTPLVGGIDQDEHPCINPGDLSLFEFDCHIWQGVVFVNISGKAKSFEIEHADVIERWKEFDQPYHIGGEASQFEMTVNTNWKLAVENYCESYHLPWVHPGLSQTSRLEDHYNIEGAENYSGQGSSVYRQLVGDHGEKFPDFDGLSDKWDQASEYISLFPNVLLGVHRDHAFAMLLMPQGPEATTERVALTYAIPGISDGDLGLLVKRNAEFWRSVFVEDITSVEGMQKGRHGVKFDGGKFSPVMDVPTHIFHVWVARQLSM